MPVNVKREVKITMPNGEILVLPDNAKIEENTDVAIICAGPRCAAHHDTDGPTTIAFNEEQVRRDPNGLPDNYARLLKLSITPFEPQELPFCGVRCLKDFLDYQYVEGKSPREKAGQASKQVELPFPPIDPIGGKLVLS